MNTPEHNPFVWQGRTDSEEVGDSRRWHHVVHPFDAASQDGVALIDQPLSLSLPATRDGESSLADTLVDVSHVAPHELMHSAVLQDALMEVFQKLSPMEADILRKRVGLDGEPELTLKEIGATYSLSRERIRQLQEQALRKLRTEFSRRQLM